MSCTQKTIQVWLNQLIKGAENVYHSWRITGTSVCYWNQGGCTLFHRGRKSTVNNADTNLPGTKSSENNLVSSCDVQEDKHNRPELKELEPESAWNYLVQEKCNFNTDHGSIEFCERCSEGSQWGNTDIIPLKLSQNDMDGCTCEEEICQETTKILMVNPKYTYPQSENNIRYSVKERR